MSRPLKPTLVREVSIPLIFTIDIRVGHLFSYSNKCMGSIEEVLITAENGSSATLSSSHTALQKQYALTPHVPLQIIEPKYHFCGPFHP